MKTLDIRHISISDLGFSVKSSDRTSMSLDLLLTFIFEAFKGYSCYLHFFQRHGKFCHYVLETVSLDVGGSAAVLDLARETNLDRLAGARCPNHNTGLVKFGMTADMGQMSQNLYLTKRNLFLFLNYMYFKNNLRVVQKIK